MSTASLSRARVRSSLAHPLALLLVCGACARPSQVVPPPPLATPQTVDSAAWILRLEDQRAIRDPLLPEPVLTEDLAVTAATTVTVAPPPSRPDLVNLLTSPEAHVRRRAALALGRVGLAEGVAPLVAALADPEEEVQQMSAFALGLIGNAEATETLMAALENTSPKVQGRAAEALARIGAESAAPAIGRMVRSYVSAAFEVDPEDLSYPQSDEVEAFRLGLYALAELKAFEPMARAVLEENYQPILWWWPVAHALQRLEDPRGLAALTTLAGVQGSVGVALAARGLGALADPRGIDALVKLLDVESRSARVVASAVRALGNIDDERSAEALNFFVRTRDLEPMLRLEAIDALGRLRSMAAIEVFTELLSHPWPPMRASALMGLAQAEPESLLFVLSGLGSDPDWRVRAALAQALEHAAPDAARYRLTLMLNDEDQRVLPHVLASLVAVRAPDVSVVLQEQLRSNDIVVRKTAARLLGELRPDGAASALAEAYRAALPDASYVARAATLEALASYGGPVARETLRVALEDPDWATRVLAAERLGELEKGVDHESLIRPAPGGRRVDYAAGHLVRPTVSPHVYIETVHGTIEIELAVIDAPLTSDNFMTLARRGFYDGLTFHRVVPNYVVQGGDPRNDSEGGPGYTLRDELNELPYLRGTVGMALDWRDTGGSQFFITHSPQPQLDGRYTVFGRVVAGMEVVDQLRTGDSIERVLVWDGVQPLQETDK